MNSVMERADKTTPLSELVLDHKGTDPDRYHKALVRGRDPRSFRQNAEVWRFINMTHSRTRKVETGRHLFGVVDDEQVRRARQQLQEAPSRLLELTSQVTLEHQETSRLATSENVAPQT